MFNANTRLLAQASKEAFRQQKLTVLSSDSTIQKIISLNILRDFRLNMDDINITEKELEIKIPQEKWGEWGFSANDQKTWAFALGRLLKCNCQLKEIYFSSRFLGVKIVYNIFY